MRVKPVLERERVIALAGLEPAGGHVLVRDGGRETGIPVKDVYHLETYQALPVLEHPAAKRGVQQVGVDSRPGERGVMVVHDVSRFKLEALQETQLEMGG